jgi:hypothetical protein
LLRFARNDGCFGTPRIAIGSRHRLNGLHKSKNLGQA